jgi:hypothetical protein
MKAFILGVSKRTDRRFSWVAQHNIDPDLPKTVLQLSIKTRLSESENLNGSDAIGN